MNSTILLVEDSADDVFFMKRAFRLAGVQHSLQVVEDGEKAIEYLAGTGPFANRVEFPLPSLVLLDLRLPRIPGFDVLQWARREQSLDCIPFVIFSSSREDVDMRRAYALRANAFLVKPSDAANLTATMKSTVDFWLLHNAVPAPSAELPLRDV